MSEPLNGRELLAIRARTMRAGDGQHQSLTQTETDRAALLGEVYRLRTERLVFERTVEHFRGFADVLDGIAEGLQSCYGEGAAHAPHALARSMRRALDTPTPTEGETRG